MRIISISTSEICVHGAQLVEYVMRLCERQLAAPRLPIMSFATYLCSLEVVHIENFLIANQYRLQYLDELAEDKTQKKRRSIAFRGASGVGLFRYSDRFR